MSFRSKSGEPANTCTTNDIGSTQICHRAAVLQKSCECFRQVLTTFINCIFRFLTFYAYYNTTSKYFTDFWSRHSSFSDVHLEQSINSCQATDTSLCIHMLLENLLILSYLSAVTAILTYRAIYSQLFVKSILDEQQQWWWWQQQHQCIFNLFS